MREDALLMHFVKHIQNQDHTRRYSIATTEAGWEVREERDSEVVKQVRYFDWHRVERARHSIVVELQELREKGWREVS